MSAAPRGRVIVYTGDGKGKTTAALGTALRAVGHGLAAAVVQFVKARPSGEHAAAERLAPDLTIRRMGAGWVTDEATDADLAAAREALAEVRRLLATGRPVMVVADEVLTAVGLGLLEREAVEGLLDARPAEKHLVLTGRGAWPALVERADLVTEMRCVKHPHERGEGPLAGIEF
ncbi:MAG: cob(I)yrinic acid a,c-diamide adenosyltransferase [Phycisphaerae bacterium]